MNINIRRRMLERPHSQKDPTIVWELESPVELNGSEYVDSGIVFSSLNGKYFSMMVTALTSKLGSKSAGDIICLNQSSPVFYIQEYYTYNKPYVEFYWTSGARKALNVVGADSTKLLKVVFVHGPDGDLYYISYYDTSGNFNKKTPTTQPATQSNYPAYTVLFGGRNGAASAINGTLLYASIRERALTMDEIDEFLQS